MIDFGRYVAAPYCGMVLSDMGAEVIRVERPGGEEDRRLGLRAAHGETFTFAGLARGKKGITLDIRRGSPARAVLCDLVTRADVLLHNFGPAAARAFGLRYEDVRAMNPAIIYAGITFSGPEGPYADRTGFDMMAQMGSGAAALTGTEGEPPLRSGVPWVDYGTGLSAAIGVLLALRHRDRSGEGQAVDCALLLTAVSFAAPMIAEAVAGGRERPRHGNQAAYLAPSSLYRCRDGRVYVTAITSGTWRALTGLIGHPELAADPELLTAEARYANRERVDELIERWTERRTVDDVVGQLALAHVPCGAYRSTPEVPHDAQVRSQAMLGCVDLRTPGLEQVPVGLTPARLSRSPAVPLSPPPRVGEHNAEVYGGLLGYSRSRLERLRSDGVI